MALPPGAVISNMTSRANLIDAIKRGANSATKYSVLLIDIYRRFLGYAQSLPQDPQAIGNVDAVEHDLIHFVDQLIQKNQDAVNRNSMFGPRATMDTKGYANLRALVKAYIDQVRLIRASAGITDPQPRIPTPNPVPTPIVVPDHGDDAPIIPGEPATPGIAEMGMGHAQMSRGTMLAIIAALVVIAIIIMVYVRRS
ncbi:MAG TPA: hypothetical protein VLA24_15770 [Pseudomonadales bacterium]|nr:hypothetical protein [Pseudomonadales bacterium]